MGWRLRLSDKTVRKFAELPIYCQRQKCTPEKRSFWQYKVYADIRGGSLGFAEEGASNESGVI